LIFLIPRLLKQIGTSVSQIKREDILWSAIDTNNIMMQRSNAFTHFHGTLVGLDVLSSKPEYTDFNEHGRTFVALDRKPDPLTPQSWWEQYKWYFYGSIIGLVSLILTCSLCWVCTCANCCLPKLLFNPCIVGYKQSKRFRKHLAKHKQLKKHHHGENMETIIQLLPPVSTTVQSTQIKDNPVIQFLPNSTVL
jgi:hypothetical protein